MRSQMGGGERGLTAIGEEVDDRQDDDCRSRGLLQGGNVPRGRCSLGAGEFQPGRNFSGAFVQALLGQRYVLIATNVPFLGQRRQVPLLAQYIESHREEAKG